MYIFRGLKTFSVVALSDVELRNNQWQTLLQISLVLLQNQVTNLEQGSRSGIPCAEHFWRCVFIHVSVFSSKSGLSSEWTWDRITCYLEQELEISK
jgi:hypothetical protein